MPHREKSALFLHLNTNKKSVTLDLESPGAPDLFRELLIRCQILIESGRPGAMDSLGLGYDQLREVRPDLVMTSITPFGQTGPYRDYEFTELTVFATSGAMYREGLPDREPLRYGGEMAQYYAGSAAAGVTMAACLRSCLDGLGRWIDISIQECLAGHPHQLAYRAPYVYSGESDSRRNPHEPTAAGVESFGAGTFRVGDGHMSFLPLGARMWPNFARMIERPDLVDDPRFNTPEGRAENHSELASISQAWLGAHTRAEVFAAAQDAGLPGGPCWPPERCWRTATSPQRGYFLDIDHPDAGSLTYTGMPFRLSEVPLTPASPAPRLGQHNSEVLGGLLGLTGSQISYLRSQRTI